jgi:hypothetical protein
LVLSASSSALPVCEPKRIANELSLSAAIESPLPNQEQCSLPEGVIEGSEIPSKQG